jgi:lipid-A-disaccharide synthase-like uncharacterized protein
MSDTVGLFEPFLGRIAPWLYYDSIWWTGFGLFGNALFSSRFLIQWLHSERQQRIVVPPVFWHLSFWGSLISLIYAFHVDKLPIILGCCFLPIIYARNLRLLRRGTPAAKVSTDHSRNA